MYIAAQNGHLEIIHILAEHKADVHLSRKADGCTPFYAAADKGYSEILRYLLKLKASVNKTTNDGAWCPLNIAAHRGFFDCVKTLVELKVRQHGNFSAWCFVWRLWIYVWDIHVIWCLELIWSLVVEQANVASIRSALAKPAHDDDKKIKEFLKKQLHPAELPPLGKGSSAAPYKNYWNGRQAISFDFKATYI